MLMLVILAPAAYIGASYYNGEDPLQNVKEITGMESADQDTKKATKKRTSKSELETLKAENKKLKKMIEQKDKEIQQLEEQLRNQ